MAAICGTVEISDKNVISLKQKDYSVVLSGSRQQYQALLTQKGKKVCVDGFIKAIELTEVGSCTNGDHSWLACLLDAYEQKINTDKLP